MRFGLIIGGLLLVAAFIAAAAESVVVTDNRSLGIVPAYDLIYILYPSELIRFRIFLQKSLDPFLWDPVMVSFLRMPAWLIIGVPGAVLLWRFRPHQGHSEEEDDDLPYNTYEDVLAAAEELSEEDELPSKYGDMADFDPADKVTSPNAQGPDAELPDLLNDENQPADSEEPNGNAHRRN